jgi:hypothetical protein
MVTAPQPGSDSFSTPLAADASIFNMLKGFMRHLSCYSAQPPFHLDWSAPQVSLQNQIKTIRNKERGAGHFKAILITLILASLVYVGFKVVPFLINEYQFQDGIQDIARYASAMRQDVAKVRVAVLKEAEKDEIPITSEDIKIEGTGGNFRISADYSVIVDLKVYQWTLNFHPSVSNNALF